MKLVVEIPEEQYITLNAKTQEEVVAVLDSKLLVNAIKNGTPLPKGHGRLIDADVLRDEVGSWGMNDYEPSDFIDEIDAADTIIEADKEQEDGNDN